MFNEAFLLTIPLEHINAILSPATSLYISGTFYVTSYPGKPWYQDWSHIEPGMGSISSHPASVGLVGPRGKETWCRWGWSTRRSSATLILVPSSWTYTEGTNKAWLNIYVVIFVICHKLGVQNIYKRKWLLLRGAVGHTRVDINTITRVLTPRHQNSNVEMFRASKNALN